MSKKRTRRRILQLVGLGASLSLAGCASVAEQMSDATEQPSPSGADGSSGTTPTREPTTPSNPTQTPQADAEPTESPSNAASENSWSTASVTIDTPDVALGDVPVPAARSQYARMGVERASVTATMYGNWKCPYTQEFVLNRLPDLVERYVVPGDVVLEFRSLAYKGDEPFLGPDAPRLARAGLAVWDLDPESYWSYFAHVFANQPQERREWGQPSLVRRFAEAAGIEGRSRLEQSLTPGTYAGPVRATTDAAAELGISTVPRVVVDGTVTAPTVDFDATTSQFDRALRR